VQPPRQELAGLCRHFQNQERENIETALAESKRESCRPRRCGRKLGIHARRWTRKSAAGIRDIGLSRSSSKFPLFNSRKSGTYRSFRHPTALSNPMFSNVLHLASVIAVPLAPATVMAAMQRIATTEIWAKHTTDDLEDREISAGRDSRFLP